MKRLCLFAVSFLYSASIFAQRVYDDLADEDDVKQFERYAHLGLSKGEILSIVVGVVLLLIAKNLSSENEKIGTGLGCLGALCVLPLVLVILAVAQKVIAYGVILAVIVGALYFLFGKNE